MFQAFLEDAVVKETKVTEDDGKAGEEGDEKQEGKADDADEEEDDDGETTLDLVKFDKKIREYLEIQSEIADLKPVRSLCCYCMCVCMCVSLWLWLCPPSQQTYSHLSRPP